MNSATPRWPLLRSALCTTYAIASGPVRSAIGVSASLVKHTRSPSRPLRLNRGNPTLLPARLPMRGLPVPVGLARCARRAGSDEFGPAADSRPTREPCVRSEQRGVEMTCQRDVEGVVETQIAPQSPRQSSEGADVWVSVIDQQPRDTQRRIGLIGADMTRPFVATQHIADLSVDQMGRMRSYSRKSGAKLIGLGRLADQAKHERRRINDIIVHRRSAARSATIDSLVAPGVSLASRTAAMAANNSSVVGRPAKSTTQSRM